MDFPATPCLYGLRETHLLLLDGVSLFDPKHHVRVAGGTEQQIWAGMMEKTKNQAFNCTSGDVFAWKSIWKLLCDMFELEFVAFKENGDKEFDIVEFMKDKREIWEGVVQRHRLFRTKMEWITCYSALQTVL
nr:iridoid synthase-like [Ipomoea batatas]GMD92166.1 iridoid synthase-like [Ipomoea batatas]